MGTQVVRTVVAAAALALIVGLVTPPGAARLRRHPPLIVATHHRPLAVTGFHFVRGERVRVAVRLRRVIARRRALASRTGIFVMRFPRLRERCRLYTIVAAGNRGSRAVTRAMPPICGS